MQDITERSLLSKSRLRVLCLGDLISEREHVSEGLQNVAEHPERDGSGWAVVWLTEWGQALDGEISRRTRRNLQPMGGARPTLDAATIASVKQSTSTVQLARDLGGDPVKNGARWKLRCILPGHEDKTPSFTIFEDGGWHCFGCNQTGDAIDLLTRIRGLSFIEAVRHLAARASIKLGGAR